MESIKMTSYINCRAQAILKESLAESSDKDIILLCKELKSIDGIIQADAYPEEDVIVLKQRDGILINVFLDSFRQAIENGDDLEGTSSTHVTTKSPISINNKKSIIAGDGNAGKALILAPLYSKDIDKFKNRQYAETLYRNMKDALEKSGYEVPDPLTDEEASFYQFLPENLAKYDVVVIVSEGKKSAVWYYDDKKSKKEMVAIRTGEKVPEYGEEDGLPLDWEIYKKSFGDKFDKLTGSTLSYSEIQYGMIKDGTYYYMTPLLFKKTEKGTLKDSWIIIGAEHSASKSDLYDVFFSAGAGAYTGLDDKLGRDEILYLTSQMVSTMCSGLELDSANERAKETAKTIKDKQVSGRKHLQSHKKNVNKLYYLYDSTPYELSEIQEEDKSFSLYFKTHPSVAERSYEVFVDDGNLIQSGKIPISADLTTKVKYNPRGDGEFKWYVQSSIVSESGTPLASFQSVTKDVYVKPDIPEKKLSISPSSLVFETYTLGTSLKSRSFTITNVGNTTVHLQKIECPTGFTCYHGDDMVISAGFPLKLLVDFVPDVAGEYSGEIVIYSDAEGSPHTVSVRGVAVEPEETSIPVTGVSLDQTQLSLTVGSEQALRAIITPNNATNQKVSWKSSDATVAKVDNNGLVTALKEGPATITVTTEDGGHTATCRVTVKDVNGQHEGTTGEEWDN